MAGRCHLRADIGILRTRRDMTVLKYLGAGRGPLAVRGPHARTCRAALRAPLLFQRTCRAEDGHLALGERAGGKSPGAGLGDLAQGADESHFLCLLVRDRGAPWVRATHSLSL